MATTEERLSALEEKMGDIPVGYTRIQMSKDTASNWEKYNPALLPGEMVIVANPDGKASVKVNMGTSDTKYEDVPTVWDESTADQLKTNLADTRQAASAAADAKTAAQKYAQQAEASAKAIKEKEILAITDSVQLAVNTEDGGLDIIVTTDE
ncbi:hypothetical protein [Acidaminococcus fermentans]|nr:hypothetical protein [Acidaminococcus fermentans]